MSRTCFGVRQRALCLAVVLTSACGESPEEEESWLSVPSDFPPIQSPEDNELTKERVALGKTLFFDKRLSRDESVSCASCHLQEHAFADPNPLSLGVDEQLGTRNAPALVNVAWGRSFFWDGGVQSLELQVLVPLTNPVEMDMSMTELKERLKSDKELSANFVQAYGEGPSDFTVTRAIASFMRTMISGESAWDRYRRGDESALSESAARGLVLFNGEQAECFHCHVGFNLTNEAYRNNGPEPDDPDIGRELLTQNALDRGKFKVPTLRNVAVTAPYMHDGSIETLREVVEVYARGGRGHPNTDPLIVPLELNEDEKDDLLAFLESLTDDAFLSDPRFRP